MDGGTISGAAASSIFTATLKISQVVYELKAVGEQTRDLLNSTNHIETSLQAVRTLRRQKSGHLDATEKRWIDDVLINTERTLGNVATLIEPARVDLQTRFGRVGIVNRSLFVFRDSPKVSTNLSRLNLASQSLNTALNILCTREGGPAIGPVENNLLHRYDGAEKIGNDTKPPPPYVESEFLNRRRQSHISRKPVGEQARPPIVEANVVKQSTTETTEQLVLEKKVGEVPPQVTVSEVNLAPVEPFRKNYFAEDDGLQVYETRSSQSPHSQSYDGADGLQVRNVPSPRILNFDGAGGLQVCDGTYSSSPRIQESPFDGADGLQACSSRDSPSLVWQEWPVDMSQKESSQQQRREERSSYQELPYPISQDEPSNRRGSLSPPLQGQQWHRRQPSSQRFHNPQSHNPPYPNSPYPSPPCSSSPYTDKPYQNTLSQNSLHHNPTYPNASPPTPPYPRSSHTHLPYPTRTTQNHQSQPFQPHHRNTQSQDVSIERQHPPSLPRRPLPLDDIPRPVSTSSSNVTSPWPLSQDPYTTTARPVSRSLDTRPLTEPPSSMSPADISRRTSQASAGSWAPCEISQDPPPSIRRSRRRAWLEYQAER